jgi:histone acetyltransferase (RNA polymerase elongator complex component)
MNDREKIVQIGARGAFANDHELDPSKLHEFDEGYDDYSRIVRNALKALEEAGGPSADQIADIMGGKSVVVPKEPTQKMIKEGKRFMPYELDSPIESYKAMLTAAQGDEG